MRLAVRAVHGFLDGLAVGGLYRFWRVFLGALFGNGQVAAQALLFLFVEFGEFDRHHYAFGAGHAAGQAQAFVFFHGFFEYQDHFAFVAGGQEFFGQETEAVEADIAQAAFQHDAFDGTDFDLHVSGDPRVFALLGMCHCAFSYEARSILV